MQSLTTGLALLFGEFFIIGAEMLAAKHFGSSPEPFRVFVYALGVSIAASVLLVYGYTYGYQAFRNIWIVTAISITSIGIVEPVLAWFLFKQAPTLGAALGLGLGVIGLLLALFVR